MPDGDFFWNACRTYTAFSNRTVYTARYALPSCDSTSSSTPGPSPFHGFAAGAVPPNCAMPRAFPMSSLTPAGKLKKSGLDDPTQCRGFSSPASTRRTVRLSSFWANSSGAVCQNRRDLQLPADEGLMSAEEYRRALAAAIEESQRLTAQRQRIDGRL